MTLADRGRVDPRIKKAELEQLAKKTEEQAPRVTEELVRELRDHAAGAVAAGRFEDALRVLELCETFGSISGPQLAIMAVCAHEAKLENAARRYAGRALASQLDVALREDLQTFAGGLR